MTENKASQLSDIEQLNAIIRLFEHPVKFLLQGGKYGLRSVGKFISVVILFFVTNIILFLFLLYRLFAYGYTHQELGWLICIVIFGILFLLYAGYRAYYVVMIDVFNLMYSNLSPFFHQLCGCIIDHSAELYASNIGKRGGKKLEQIICFTSQLSVEFGKRIPRLIQWVFSFILNRIPVIGMLCDMKQTIESGDREKAESQLFGKVDQYIHESIFKPNNLRYIFWLLPLNILFIIVTGIILID
jgi:hypothetical protein